jgi:hypothetical protein
LTICQQWREVLDGMTFRHLDRGATPVLELGSGEHPALNIRVEGAVDTVTHQRMGSLSISSIELTYFPGKRLAEVWLAAAWAGYMQHEALELVQRTDGTRPLDPHGVDKDVDRGLRHGMPVKLTPETLIQSLCAVMPVDTAMAIVGGAP